MPKVAKVGQFRKTAAAESTSTTKVSALPGGELPFPAPEDQISRGQRKRQAKRDQYLKRQNLVLSTLQLKRIEDQKTRIDGLDALKAALLATRNSDSSSTTTTRTTTLTTTKPSHALDRNQSKMELTAREVHHMELVLEHPAFSANPFATIQEHLRNTLKDQKKLLETKATIRNEADARRLEETKTRKREQHEEAGGNKGKKYTAAVKARKAAMNSRRGRGNMR